MSDENLTLSPALYEELSAIIESLKSFQAKVFRSNASNPTTGFDDFCRRLVQRRFSNRSIACEHYTEDARTKVVCIVSREHLDETYPFWYTFHRRQAAFLKASEESYVLIGCKSEEHILRIVFSRFENLLARMAGPDGQGRWQIRIKRDNGRYILLLKGGVESADLTDCCL